MTIINSECQYHFLRNDNLTNLDEIVLCSEDEADHGPYVGVEVHDWLGNEQRHRLGDMQRQLQAEHLS